jgi:hypothetical protein
VAPTVDLEAMNEALLEQRGVLFQAMGIVRMATHVIREPSYSRADTDAWTSLDAAYALLSAVADRLESSGTMLADEVSHGEY